MPICRDSPVYVDIPLFAPQHENTKMDISQTPRHFSKCKLEEIQIKMKLKVSLTPKGSLEKVAKFAWLPGKPMLSSKVGGYPRNRGP